GDNLIVLGTFTFTAGTIDTGNIEARGNVNISSTLGGSATLSFTGSSSQTYTNSGGSAAAMTGKVTVNKTAGSVILGSTGTFNGASQDFNIASGIVDMSTFPFTVGRILSVSGSLIQGSGMITFGTMTVTSTGTWTNVSVGSVTVGSGGVTNSGLITLDGSGAG